MRSLCQKQGIAIGYNPNPHDVKTDALWRGLLRRHAERMKKDTKRLLDDALIPQISAVRSAVLNRLSHTGPPALTEPNVRAAIATVKAFQSTAVPFEP